MRKLIGMILMMKKTIGMALGLAVDALAKIMRKILNLKK